MKGLDFPRNHFSPILCSPLLTFFLCNQDPELVESMNGANKARSYDIPASSFALKFGAAPKAAAKPAAKAAPKPAARAAPKPAAKPAAKPATGRVGSVRK